MKRLGILTAVFLVVIAITAFLKLSGPGIRALRSRGESGAVAKRIRFQEPGSIKKWDEKVLSGKKTAYIAADHKGKSCVKAVSEDSASTLIYKERLSYKDNPFISWDWVVDKFPTFDKGEDLESKKEFDFAAQVYVVFHSRHFLSAKAIQYVWTESLPVGSVSSSPYTNNVKILVLESGPSEEWKHEKRDIAVDFKELFGEELEKDIVAIAFMTDSDSTSTDASAYYSGFTLGFLGGARDEAGTEQERFKSEFDEWLQKIMFWKKNEGGGH